MIPDTLPSMPIADGTPLQFGEQVFTFGQDVLELRDSAPLVAAGDFPALRVRMEEDGYLFVRGFHPRPVAERAAHFTLEAIARQGGIKNGTAPAEGLSAQEGQSFAFFRDLSVSHAPEILEAVDGSHARAFYEGYFGEPVLTFDKRWLRAMGKGGNNFFHYDSAYVGRGTRRRLTTWSAFTEIPLNNGPLVLCLESHRDERLKATYGQLDMDRDLADAVFSQDAREMVEKFGFKLATTHFQPGDALHFGMHLMHASAPNQTNHYRISVDTRYQPASEAKDERFFGANGTWQGNFYQAGATYTPMSELRAQWDLE